MSKITRLRCLHESRNNVYRISVVIIELLCACRSLRLSLSLAHSSTSVCVFYMGGSLNVHCRSLLIKREVNQEHVCNSSYESHLALNNSVIYAFDNSNRDAFSNNKVALKDDNNGTLVSLEMKRCLALWQPFFFLYFYLFILLFVTLCFSISYQRLLMKENVESVLHL